MDLMEVKLLIHVHPMTLLKDGRMGNCCGIKFKAISDGYYCTECDLFFHENCCKAPAKIYYPSHDVDKITGGSCTSFEVDCNGWLNLCDYDGRLSDCIICSETILKGIKTYQCRASMVPCGFGIHMECVKYPPPEVINVPHNHDHKLMLQKTRSRFTCAACRKDGDGYSYKCLHECHLIFHVNCGKYAAEVKHPTHSLHPLKLFTGEPPVYTDGKCRLCGGKLANSEVFYHCSTCNFSIDMHCVLNPPKLYHYNIDTHAHDLTLMPKLISFTCTTCGLNGDRSPYVCLQCDFTSHNDCSGFPWVININRHNHRVTRTSLLGVVNSVCGVCRKKMDWSCGGYSCQKCSEYVFHTKCATREDVSDGIEMKDEPEEDEDVEPFRMIDENTIQHFIHDEHSLRLDKFDMCIEERSCKACNYPIYHDAFYSCMSSGCNFKLHESCANMPTRKRHMVSNRLYILDKTDKDWYNCDACGVCYNGFTYKTNGLGLDVRCASVSEPFFHQSHPDHALFYTSPRGVCSACKKEASYVLRCVEEGCRYVLDFNCALLPYKVKHRVDDHLLSLSYGEEYASGTYWCDICEKETDPKAWFYTCKDCGVTLHTDCVLGDFRALEPGRKVLLLGYNWVESMMVRNNSMSRPLCNQCKFHCIFSIILKVVNNGIPGNYYCSIKCFEAKHHHLPMYGFFQCFRHKSSYL